MAIDAVLQFDTRSNSKAENIRLIKDGYLLGNVNGRGMESVAIAVKKDEFKKVYKKHGRNCIIKLENQGKQGFEVMVKEIQMNPKDYDYHHVDFHKIGFKNTVKAEVTVKYTGLEYLQAKRLILNRLTSTITVSGLPQDIPHTIEFDLSNMEAGDNIYVGDLKYPEGIKPENDEKELIGSILGA